MPPSSQTATQVQANPYYWSRALALAASPGATVTSVAAQVQQMAGVTAQVARGVATRAMNAHRAAFSLQYGLSDDPVERLRIGINPNLPAGSPYRTHAVVEYKSSTTGRVNRVYTVMDWISKPSYTDLQQRIEDEQAAIQQEAWLKYKMDTIDSPTIQSVTVISLERRS